MDFVITLVDSFYWNNKRTHDQVLSFRSILLCKGKDNVILRTGRQSVCGGRHSWPCVVNSVWAFPKQDCETVSRQYWPHSTMEWCLVFLVILTKYLAKQLKLERDWLWFTVQKSTPHCDRGVVLKSASRWWFGWLSPLSLCIWFEPQPQPMGWPTSISFLSFPQLVWRLVSCGIPNQEKVVMGISHFW